MRLTPLGKVMLSHARELLARCRGRRDERFRAGADGRIDIGTFQSVSSVLLPAYDASLRRVPQRRHPAARGREHRSDTARQRRPRPDLHGRPTRPDFVTTTLLDDPSCSARLASSPGRWRSISSTACRWCNTRRGATSAGSARRSPSSASARSRCSSPPTTARSWRWCAGLGPAISPLLCVDIEPDDPDLELHALIHRSACTIQLAWLPDRTQSPIASCFIEIATDAAAAPPRRSHVLRHRPLRASATVGAPCNSTSASPGRACSVATGRSPQQPTAHPTACRLLAVIQLLQPQPGERRHRSRTLASARQRRDRFSSQCPRDVEPNATADVPNPSPWEPPPRSCRRRVPDARRRSTVGAHQRGERSRQLGDAGRLAGERGGDVEAVGVSITPRPRRIGRRPAPARDDRQPPAVAGDRRSRHAPSPTSMSPSHVPPRRSATALPPSTGRSSARRSETPAADQWRRARRVSSSPPAAARANSTRSVGPPAPPTSGL